MVKSPKAKRPSSEVDEPTFNWGFLLTNLVILFALCVAGYSVYVNSVFTSYVCYPDKCLFSVETSNTSHSLQGSVFDSKMIIGDNNGLVINPFIRQKSRELDKDEAYAVLYADKLVDSIDYGGEIFRPFSSMPFNVLNPNGTKSYFFVVPKDLSEEYCIYKVYSSKSETSRAREDRLDVKIPPGGCLYMGSYYIGGSPSVIFCGDIDFSQNKYFKFLKPSNDEVYIVIQSENSRLSTISLGGHTKNKYLHKSKLYGTDFYRYLYIVPKSSVSTEGAKTLPSGGGDGYSDQVM